MVGGRTMDLMSGDISALVFKRIIRDGLGEFSLDGHMLSVLMELDGKSTVRELAQKVGLNLSAMREVISRLLKLKLIEPVENDLSILDKEFFEYLVGQLSLAVGPIAEILAEDAIVDLGLDTAQVPSHRAAELVDLLARQIQKEDKKAAFKQNMVKRINGR